MRDVLPRDGLRVNRDSDPSHACRADELHHGLAVLGLSLPAVLEPLADAQRALAVGAPDPVLGHVACGDDVDVQGATDAHARGFQRETTLSTSQSIAACAASQAGRR